MNNSIAPSDKKPTDSIDLNRATIETALLKTPTGGNAKPFTWCWINNETLEIIYHADLAAHYLNRNNHSGWIALGCLIESVYIAAGVQGFAINPTTDYTNLNTLIRFSAANSRLPEDLYFQLLKRSTFRGSVTSSLAPTLEYNNQSDIRARLLPAQATSAKIKKFFTAVDSYIWIQSKATVSFFKEIIFFNSNSDQRGILSQNLGINKVDQFMLYLFSFVPTLLSYFVRIPLLNLSFKLASKRNIANAHFVLITSTSLDPAHLIQAGRKSFKTWIQLEQQGYSVQPYSSASLTLLDAAAGHLPDDTSPFFRKLFTEDGPKIFGEEFNLSHNENPIWLLRVGKKG